MTIDSTCPLTATPLPVTAALTSLGVCVATGSPRRAAATITTAAACAVPITVRTFCWLKTRSTATASGVTRSSHRSTSASMASRRRAGSSSLAVRTIPTSTRRSGAPGAPSTAPKPHLVSPGSTPSTRSGTHLARDRGSALVVSPGNHCRRTTTPSQPCAEHLFGSHQPSDVFDRARGDAPTRRQLGLLLT